MNVTPGLSGIRTIEEIPLTGKKVFIRLDLNVPLKKGEITDDTRIRAAIPTIEYALKQKAKVVLASHLGRPKGLPEDRTKYSLLPVGNRLSHLLNKEVILFEDPDGEGIKGVLGGLNENQIILLENTRFCSGEEANSTEWANHLASFTEVYINDAFGAIHRAHATVAALPNLVNTKGIGFLIQKEIQMLDQLLYHSQRPFVTILGGAKVSDKIGVIENLLERVDTFLIGGAMAYTFLAAQNTIVGRSLVEKDKIYFAKEIIDRCRLRNKKLILPIDHLAAAELKENVAYEQTSTSAIPSHLMGLDIGPKTLDLMKQEIAQAKTVFWNGPLGAFETPPFDRGTMGMARVLAESNAITIVGGGDSVAAVEKAQLSQKMTHISTGGGASLEYLEGKTLPGLEAVRGPRS